MDEEPYTINREEGDTVHVDIIPERDATVIQDPTSVWLLKPDTMGELRLYEQWEQHRPFKAKAVYHDPTHGDFYLKNSDDHFGVKVGDTDSPLEQEDNELDLAPERPGPRHQLKVDDNIWSFASRHNTTAEKLIKHNEIDDLKAVTPGTWLYIPKPEPKERPQIEYRLLSSPRPMHTTRDANKWTFGNVKEWKDIKQDLKSYKEGYNVDIVAIAQVPVEGITVAYYMDKHDIGTYAETGRPTSTRGFNWQHLEMGHIKKEKVAVTPSLVAASAMLEDDRLAILKDTPVTTPRATDEPVVIEEESLATTTSPLPMDAPVLSYKDTFRYLNFEESPERYRMLQAMDIRDLDGGAPPVTLKEGRDVMIIGWFEYEGTPYYRVSTRYWYAIPTQAAHCIENDPFNVLDIDLPTRIAHGGALSREEQHLATIARTVAKYKRLAAGTKRITTMLRRK